MGESKINLDYYGNFRIAVWFALGACSSGPPNSALDGSDTDVDTDNDTDADTDSDSDADTDTDTNTDTNWCDTEIEWVAIKSIALNPEKTNSKEAV